VGTWSRCINWLPNFLAFRRITYQIAKTGPNQLLVQSNSVDTWGSSCGGSGTQQAAATQFATITFLGEKSTVLGYSWDKVEVQVEGIVRKELMTAEASDMYMSWYIDAFHNFSLSSHVGRDSAGWPSDWIVVQQVYSLIRQ
jgi:hypothetical protein